MSGMEPLRIGDLSRSTGLAVRTLRYYADQGLFGKLPRTGKDYRLFPAEAVEWVRLLRAAQSSGFSLREISAMLGALRRGSACCLNMRAVLSDRLGSVRTQIRELEALASRLATTLGTPDGSAGPLPCSLASRLVVETSRHHPVSAAR